MADGPAQKRRAWCKTKLELFSLLKSGTLVHCTAISRQPSISVKLEWVADCRSQSPSSLRDIPPFFRHWLVPSMFKSTGLEFFQLSLVEPQLGHKNDLAFKSISSFKEYLVENKPEFVEVADERRKVVNEAKAQREEIGDKNRLQFMENYEKSNIELAMCGHV